MTKNIDHQFIASVSSNLTKGTTFVVDGNMYLAVNDMVNYTIPPLEGEGIKLTTESRFCSFIDLDHSENWVYSDNGKCIIHGGALIDRDFRFPTDAEFNESVWDMLPKVGDGDLLADLLGDLINENLLELSNRYYTHLDRNISSLPKFEYSKFLHERNR